jgi:hypothetical protein
VKKAERLEDLTDYARGMLRRVGDLLPEEQRQRLEQMIVDNQRALDQFQTFNAAQRKTR